jgi:hypothetical protein
MMNKKQKPTGYDWYQVWYREQDERGHEVIREGKLIVTDKQRLEYLEWLKEVGYVPTLEQLDYALDHDMFSDITEIRKAKQDA